MEKIGNEQIEQTIEEPEFIEMKVKLDADSMLDETMQYDDNIKEEFDEDSDADEESQKCCNNVEIVNLKDEQGFYSYSSNNVKTEGNVDLGVDYIVSGPIEDDCTLDDKYNDGIPNSTVDCRKQILSTVCDLCDKSFEKTDELHQHQLRQHKRVWQRCLACHKNFPTLISLKIHQSASSVCKICKIDFKYPCAVIRHRCPIPIAQNMFKRSVAAVSVFSSDISFDKVEELTKNNEESQKCSSCRKIFPNINSLKDHQSASSICKICKIDFKYPCAVIRHRCPISVFLNKRKTSLPEVSGILECIFLCDDCNMSFDNAEALNEHQLTKHKATTYDCKFCSANFPDKISLKSHNSEPAVCSICRKDYIYVCALTGHKCCGPPQAAQNVPKPSVNSEVPKSTVSTNIEDEIIIVDSDQEISDSTNLTTNGKTKEQQKQVEQVSCEGSKKCSPLEETTRDVRQDCRSDVTLKDLLNSYSTNLTPKVDIDEHDATGISIAKKLRRMDPVQAIYADAIIHSVLRRGLLKALMPQTTLCDNQCGSISQLPSCPAPSSTSLPITNERTQPQSPKMQSTSSHTNEEFVCKECDTIFETRSEFKLHEERVTEMDDILRCPKCYKFFENIKEAHLHQIGKVECLKCGKKLELPCMVSLHSCRPIMTPFIPKTTNVFLVCCKDCSEIFLNQADYVNHMQNKHNVNTEEMTCKKCDLIFIKKEDLLTHEDFCHRKDLHRCNKCRKIFNESFQLYMHHQGPTVCPVCDINVEIPCMLNKHQCKEKETDQTQVTDNFF